MKLEVINWVTSWVLSKVSKSIEILFRTILLIMPLGLFLLVIQSRDKVSSVSNLSVYTKDESVWQHVFPGFILISLDKDGLRNGVSKKVYQMQEWLKRYKYLLVAVFCLVLITLITVGVIKCYK